MMRAAGTSAILTWLDEKLDCQQALQKIAYEPPSPVIIEAALDGVTTRKRHPGVPRTPDEISAEAIVTKSQN